MSSDHHLYLRTHSYYSFLDSLLSPDDLVELAEQHGIKVLGLTDRHYLTGAISFYEACIKHHIKPILGLEIDISYFGTQGLITLMAMDMEGWANLCRLSTALLVEEKPISLEFLSTHQQGLLAIIGSPNGVLRNLILDTPTYENDAGKFINDFRKIFSEDLFIEIQRFTNGPLQGESLLIHMARQYQVPIIATQNIYFKKPKDIKTYRTLTAIKTNQFIHSLSTKNPTIDSAHFPTRDDFLHRFRDLPIALENLQLVNNRCNLELPLGQMHYPVVKTPKGQTQADVLRQRAYAGTRTKYATLTAKITERLDDELNIISELGYEPIFLIVEEILNHARKLGIPTSSRGSAASSIVAHCLDITSPDPIALDLYFERFLNPARQKPPDIDTDIASHRRDEVIQYVFDKFGSTHVAMVSTINRYRPKSAISDVGKAYGLPLETIRQLTRKCPSSYGSRLGFEEKDPFTSLGFESKIPHIDEIIRDARKLIDMPKHLSVHPGGIVISPFPITNLVPLVHSSSVGLNHTQFGLDCIEKLGLVKIDLLGIKGLTVIGEVANQIQTWRLSEFKIGLDVLDSIPDKDQATASTISEGKTIGCFQIESPGMRATLREIQAKSVDDIMAALALYRPGPLRGGLRDAFVRRFRGEEQITHLHSALKELLGSTYGVILYQEQVLRIAHELGGLSIAQADILRRVMSHFDSGGVMDTLKRRFIEGAIQNKQVPPDVAERIWEMMAAFAGYGFPKAHAASYARLAWNSAWCKTHYPAELMSAVLSYGGGYYSQRVYMMESRRLGLTVKPPHINYSHDRFRVRYPGGLPVIYMGLGQVRDLSFRTINAIIRHQPFTSIEDFIIRVDPQKKEAQNLVKCNALDGLISIEDGLAFLNYKQTSGQYQLFKTPSSKDEWDLDRKIQAQQEILGISLELTPLERFAEQIQATGSLSTAQTLEYVGERVTIAGMKQSLRRFKTKSNQTMCYLNLEDLEGSLQILVPPHLYRNHYMDLQEPGPFLIQGIMEMDDERRRYFLRAEKLKSLTNSS